MPEQKIADVEPSGLTPRQAFLVLNGLPEIGPILTRRLLDAFQDDVLALFQSPAKRLQQVSGVGASAAEKIVNWKRYFDLEREESEIQKRGLEYILQTDAAYPSLLRQLNDAPLGLYWKGDYKIDRPCVAIVGTRRATLYGHSVTRRIAGDLARLGFCVVSGMARGTDTAAHEGALAVGGKTVAVFGCGMKTVYPPENLDLCREIVKTGAVASEFTIDRRTDRQTFPMRNRIVAGMCEAIIVVESDLKGGSMITARFAGEQGRQVFAVPGRIDQVASRGCHQLIREGAILVTGVDDILEELNYRKQDFQLDLDLAEERQSSAAKLNADLNDEESAVYQLFSEGDAIHPDDLGEKAGLAPWQVSSILIKLELKGVLIKRADGRFEAKH